MSKCEECKHDISMCLCIGIEHRAADAELAKVVAWLRGFDDKGNLDPKTSEFATWFADALERKEHRK